MSSTPELEKPAHTRPPSVAWTSTYPTGKISPPPGGAPPGPPCGPASSEVAFFRFGLICFGLCCLKKAARVERSQQSVVCRLSRSNGPIVRAIFELGAPSGDLPAASGAVLDWRGVNVARLAHARALQLEPCSRPISSTSEKALHDLRSQTAGASLPGPVISLVPYPKGSPPSGAGASLRWC